MSWYPAQVTVPAASGPVSVDDIRKHLRIDGAEDSEHIAELIASGRDHVEHYCGIRIATQTVAAKADSFADFARVPEAPVQSITSITYIDTAGAEQTLSTDVYELRADGLDAAIVRKYGQEWPAVQHGSRITLTAVVGFQTVPPAILQAIRLLVGQSYHARENEAAPTGSTVDALLSNFRRGV